MRAFVASALGGPAVYAGRDMAAAHRGLHITDAAFDAVVGHLVGALDSLGVPAAPRNTPRSARRSRRCAPRSSSRAPPRPEFPRPRRASAPRIRVMGGCPSTSNPPRPSWPRTPASSTAVASTRCSATTTPRASSTPSRPTRTPMGIRVGARARPALSREPAGRRAPRPRGVRRGRSPAIAPQPSAVRLAERGHPPGRRPPVRAAGARPYRHRAVLGLGRPEPVLPADHVDRAATAHRVARTTRTSPGTRGSRRRRAMPRRIEALKEPPFPMALAFATQLADVAPDARAALEKLHDFVPRDGCCASPVAPRTSSCDRCTSRRSRARPRAHRRRRGRRRPRAGRTGPAGRRRLDRRLRELLAGREPGVARPRDRRRARDPARQRPRVSGRQRRRAAPGAA